MKTELTKEQSKHLCELGFPKWKVKEIKPCEIDLKEWIPTITISDLLEMLPKEINNRSDLQISWNSLADKWFVGYEYCQSYAEELIDALYELTVWCSENGYLKFE